MTFYIIYMEIMPGKPNYPQPHSLVKEYKDLEVSNGALMDEEIEAEHNRRKHDAKARQHERKAREDEE